MTSPTQKQNTDNYPETTPASDPYRENVNEDEARKSGTDTDSSSGGNNPGSSTNTSTGSGTDEQ